MPMKAWPPYEQTCTELERRIRQLIKQHPDAAKCEDAWGLFAFGLKVDDLQPSLAQANAAFNATKAKK